VWQARWKAAGGDVVVPIVQDKHRFVVHDPKKKLKFTTGIFSAATAQWIVGMLVNGGLVLPSAF
jgi:hypothetical protein